MRIAFIHPGRAILPGLEAYLQFFPRYNIETTVCVAGSESIPEADVEWHFMGTGGKRTGSGALLIHEYASASVPPLAKAKDRLKKMLNATPDFRIYLNEYVKQRLDFTDLVPYGYRDVGVDKTDLSEHLNKQYDFILPGSLYPYSLSVKLFEKFTRGSLREKLLLVISPHAERFRNRFRKAENIRFLDRLSYADMMQYVKASRFGLNIRPQQAPFQFQTSSKVLDFCAAGIPVITTDSYWVREFLRRHGGRFLILKEDLSNLDPGQLEYFSFEFPELESLSWERQIRGSGILEFFQKQGLITL